MAATTLPSRRSSRPAGGVRSPIPLLLAGIFTALLLLLAVALPSRRPPVDPTTSTTLSEQEALTIVAEKMRSGSAAVDVMARGRAEFDGGTWRVTVGDARFYFTSRNGVVVPDNEAARALKFRDSAP